MLLLASHIMTYFVILLVHSKHCFSYNKEFILVVRKHEAAIKSFNYTLHTLDLMCCLKQHVDCDIWIDLSLSSKVLHLVEM